MADSLEAKREKAVEVLLDRIIADAKERRPDDIESLAGAYALCSEEWEYARGEGRSNSRL